MTQTTQTLFKRASRNNSRGEKYSDMPCAHLIDGCCAALDYQPICGWDSNRSKAAWCTQYTPERI